MRPAVERLIASRVEQGFDRQVDVSTLDAVVGILRAPPPSNEEGRPQRRPVPSTHVPAGRTKRTAKVVAK